MKTSVSQKLFAVRSWLKQVRRKITYSDTCIHFLASLAVFLILLYFQTLKIRTYFHPEFLKIDRSRAFYGFWHGRQFLLVPYFGKWNGSLMTDISWAGNIQTEILSRFGYTVVRGSSKRKGVQALLNMKKAMEAGCAGAIAMDGPRGPIYTAKPGILFLARKMGYPIVPLTASSDRAWILKNTWCHYLLPKPFSRCYIAMGEPLWKFTEDGNSASEDLDRIVIEWTERADRKVGRNPENVRST